MIYFLHTLRASGGIGIHEGLKIPWSLTVRVQVPPGPHFRIGGAFDMIESASFSLQQLHCVIKCTYYG